MARSIIEVNDLSKTYVGYDVDKKDSGVALWVKNVLKLTSNQSHQTKALDNISFVISEAESLGIFGANGAGKTTLIKILSGLLYPSEGTVSVGGHSEIQEIKNWISYISTNGWMGLEWQLSAYENLVLYANLFGLSGKAVDQHCNEILNDLHLYQDRGKYISQLSAGMRQKLTIARGLLLDRPIIYFDEPTVSLDVNAAQDLRVLIHNQLRNSGKTVIIASHTPEDLVGCDRILFLHQGKLTAIGQMEELKAPLQNSTVVTVKCPVIPEEVYKGIQTLPGVNQVTSAPANGERAYQMIKIIIDRSSTNPGKIIDHFIAQDIAILKMENREASLQEVYEHHVGMAVHE